MSCSASTRRSAPARSRWTRSPLLPFSSPSGPEVGAAGDAGLVDGVQPRREHAGLLALAAVEGALDVPVGRDAELDPLALLVDDQAGGHRLDAAGGQAGHHLLPEDRRDLVAVEAVQDAPRLLGLDEVVVDRARVGDRVEDRLAGDLVEDHPVHGDVLRLQLVEEVPGDGLTLAVLVRGEVQLVGVLEQRLELGDVRLLVARHHVVGLEAVLDVDREAAPRLVLDAGRACPPRSAGGRGCGRSRTRRRSRTRGSHPASGPSSVTRRSRACVPRGASLLLSSCSDPGSRGHTADHGSASSQKRQPQGPTLPPPAGRARRGSAPSRPARRGRRWRPVPR